MRSSPQTLAPHVTPFVLIHLQTNRQKRPIAPLLSPLFSTNRAKHAPQVNSMNPITCETAPLLTPLESYCSRFYIEGRRDPFAPIPLMGMGTHSMRSNSQCYLSLTEKLADAPKNAQCCLSLTDIISRNYQCCLSLKKKGRGRVARTPASNCAAGYPSPAMQLGMTAGERRAQQAAPLRVRGEKNKNPTFAL
jgi:hypothetical protein